MKFKVELGRADPAGATPVGVDERRQPDELEVPADPLGLPGPAVLGRQHLLDARAALPAARARLGEGRDQQLGLLSQPVANNGVPTERALLSAR